VTSAVFGTTEPHTVEDKKEFLLSHGIAVWDVIASCDIEGSSDSSIRDVTPNDLSRILVVSGDLNGDGNANTMDARMVLKYLLQHSGLEEDALIAADYNHSGGINTGDVRDMLRAALT